MTNSLGLKQEKAHSSTFPLFKDDPPDSCPVEVKWHMLCVPGEDVKKG